MRCRVGLGAVLLLLCAVAFSARGEAAPGCLPACPVESIAAPVADTALPCLRDPGCGGGTTATALALLAVIGVPLPVRPAALAVVRRPRRTRPAPGRGAARPPARPPSGE